MSDGAALKRDARVVTQFLINMDKSNPFDPYVLIPSHALPTWDIEGCLGQKDYGHVNAYLLGNSGERPLVFQLVITVHAIRQNGYEYQ